MAEVSVENCLGPPVSWLKGLAPLGVLPGLPQEGTTLGGPLCSHRSLRKPRLVRCTPGVHAMGLASHGEHSLLLECQCFPVRTFLWQGKPVAGTVELQRWWNWEAASSQRQPRVRCLLLLPSRLLTCGICAAAPEEMCWKLNPKFIVGGICR